MGNISLHGKWQVELKENADEKIYDIVLPSTTEENKIGKKNENQELGYLTRKYLYNGTAIYRKFINITEEFSEKDLELFMERTKPSKVYIDGIFIGENNNTIIPQKYKINQLSVGKHILEVHVNNDLSNNEYIPKEVLDSHQFTDNTQTNWNGILGEIYIRPLNKVYIEEVVLINNHNEKTVEVEIKINNDYKEYQNIDVLVNLNDNNNVIGEKKYKIEVKSGKSFLKLIYDVNDNIRKWDEFNHNIYDIEVKLKCHEKIIDKVKKNIGFCDFKSINGSFIINGIKGNLRGKHDACVFPITGYAPMNVEEWCSVFKKAKSYGINHYRFHTWCPPEAAFTAADIVGVYLQPELGFFATRLYDIEDDECDLKVLNYIKKEGENILREYGNHPSFIMFAIGNELHGKNKAFEDIIRHFKKVRRDILYTQGSNNRFYDPEVTVEDDFFVTTTTKPGVSIRGSMSHADKPLGHIQTEKATGTEITYENELLDINIPVISHEIGQYQMYPDYSEIDKYTGVVSPENLKIFKKRLEEKKLGHLADKFFKASGALATLCYKEEIEAAERTKNLSGYQLLDIQDFPGQGTALVGILNSFMESKGIISEEEWRSFCNDTVLLAKFDKYSWTKDEIFKCDILLYNYGEKDFVNDEILVSLISDGKIIDSKTVNVKCAKRGDLYELGGVEFKLDKIKTPSKVDLSLSLNEYSNIYSLWVYGSDKEYANGEVNIIEADKANINDIKLQINNGKNSLIIAPNINKEKSVDGFFASDFWCYPMFAGICESLNKEKAPGTLGILCNENHPCFNEFPTEYYSNWQWWPIVYYSRPMILDNLANIKEPLVRVIDNFERNNSLGILFECKVGDSKVMVCSSDIMNNLNYPEVKQYLISILSYMNSDSFAPKEVLDIDDISNLIK